MSFCVHGSMCTGHIRIHGFLMSSYVHDGGMCAGHLLSSHQLRWGHGRWDQWSSLLHLLEDLLTSYGSSSYCCGCLRHCLLLMVEAGLVAFDRQLLLIMWLYKLKEVGAQTCWDSKGMIIAHHGLRKFRAQTYWDSKSELTWATRASLQSNQLEAPGLVTRLM